MWKKLQTYLTIAATALTTSMFFCRFAGVIGPDGEMLKIMYYEKISYLVMLIMLLTGSLLAILTHKLPFLQSRSCMLVGLMFIGFQLWLGVDFFIYRKEMIFSVTMLFPALCAALEIMAARRALVDGMTLHAVKNLKKKK